MNYSYAYQHNYISKTLKKKQVLENYIKYASININFKSRTLQMNVFICMLNKQWIDFKEMVG